MHSPVLLWKSCGWLCKTPKILLGRRKSANPLVQIANRIPAGRPAARKAAGCKGAGKLIYSVPFQSPAVRRHREDSANMAEDRITTQEMDTILGLTTDLEPTLEELADNMDAPSFPDYLAQRMEERGITPQQLSVQALLSRSFTYQICSGARAPSRDMVLRLAIALKLTVAETQQMLRIAQRGALYARVRRDAIFIFCLSRRLTLYDADELLLNQLEQPLLQKENEK